MYDAYRTSTNCVIPYCGQITQKKQANPMRQVHMWPYTALSVMESERNTRNCIMIYNCILYALRFTTTHLFSSFFLNDISPLRKAYG